MGPKSPNDAVGQLINALNSGNLDAAVSLYEPSAVLVAQPGKVARGTTALREALSAFIALKPALVSRRGQVIEGDGGGLYTSDWSLTGTGPTGQQLGKNGGTTPRITPAPGVHPLHAFLNPSWIALI